MSCLEIFCHRIFLILLISTTILVSANTSCCEPFGSRAPYFREDYTYEETADAFYKLNRASIPWSDAVSWCREEGAELAFPASEHEAQILLKHFAHATHQVWLAIHDQYAEGVFIATNGSSISKLYNNWLMGQPDDNGAAGEDCVTLSQEGYFTDEACNRKLMFVCKKSNTNIILNPECLTYDPGYKLSPVTNSCYKVHPEPRTWHEAFRICEAEMGWLVELNSQEEVDYLIQEQEKYPESSLVGTYTFKYVIHVDFNDLLFENHYVTRTGKTLQQAGFDIWQKDQPNKGGEHCGCLGRNVFIKKLHDLGCETTAMFVCEKRSAKTN